MFKNGMDINIKCILWKKCLGFDQMHFGIIMQMFSVYKNRAEINSAIPCRGEIWSLFCPQGLGGTSLCVSYFCDKTPKNFANQIVPSKASFSLSVRIRSSARWHTCTHPPALWILCPGSTRACSLWSLSWLVRDAAACGSHYGSGSLARLSQTHKHTERRGSVAPWEERRPRS